MATSPLFEVLKLFTTKQYPTWMDLPEEMKVGYSQFMINRFLSSKEYLLPLLENLTCKRLSDEQHYNLLMNAVRPGFTRFDYSAYKKTPEDDELISALCKEYQIGKREARIYADELPETEKDKIKEKWADFYKYVIGK